MSGWFTGIATVVLLLMAIAVNAAIPVPEGALPAVALQSAELLVLERVIAFFATGLLLLIVIARAFRGELPVEISGRGVKYAPIEPTQRALDGTQLSLRALLDEVQHLATRNAALEATVSELA